MKNITGKKDNRDIFQNNRKDISVIYIRKITAKLIAHNLHSLYLSFAGHRHNQERKVTYYGKEQMQSSGTPSIRICMSVR